jgi:hypothetical protein
MPDAFGVFRVKQPLGSIGPFCIYEGTGQDGNPVRLTAVQLPSGLEEADRSRITSTLERTVAARMESPAVNGFLGLLGGGEQDGMLYLAEMWPEPPSLREQVLSAGPLSVTAAVNMLQSVALALDAAHQAGLHHVWLSPDNVFVSGASVSMGGQLWCALLPMLRRVAPGFEWPADAYVAPEVLGGDLGDPVSEAFSAAALAVFAMTGQDPTPSALSAVDMPQVLSDALRASLSRDPAERCSCVKAIIVELAVEQAITLQDAADTEEVPTGGEVPDWAAALLRDTSQRRAAGKPLVDEVSEPQPVKTAAAPAAPIPPPTLAPPPPFVPPVASQPRPAAPEVIHNPVRRPASATVVEPRSQPAARNRTTFNWNEGSRNRKVPIGVWLTAGAALVFIVLGIALTMMH